MNPTCPIPYEEIEKAAARIAPFAKVTPVLTCSALDRMASKQLFFKCENFQKVGAFKFRGACNSILKLLQNENPPNAVITHSSGNHAQALSLAAKMNGLTAYIVMPKNSPEVKRRAVLDYGGKVILCEPTLQSREETASKIQKETGATFIHPYDNPDIIAGQGTMAIEFLQQVPDLECIVVPIGGGGMISGICTAAKAINREIKIYGAEPLGANDAFLSKRKGEFIPQTNPTTCADGLRTSMGTLTWPIIRDFVDQIFTVSEEEIERAMRLIWERMKIVIEPSAAVGLAVCLGKEFKEKRERKVGVILCGGNIDLQNWSWSKL